MDPELHINASEYREHSQKSRNSGKSINVETSENIVHQTLEIHVHPGDSESREHSKNSRGKEAEVTVSAEITKCPAANSNFPEDSQNSLSSGKREMDNREPKVSFGNSHARCLVMASKFRELSPNSWVKTEDSGGTQK